MQFIPCSGQPPIFTLEPQDAVVPMTGDNATFIEALHCAHNSPNTTVTWYRGSVQITNGGTRTIHDNGTLEFHPLIANVDLTEEGVEYHCILTNASGSVISRTAILKLPSKLLFFINVSVMLREKSCLLLGILSFKLTQKLFLNQARRPARAWFLKIDPVQIVCMHVCVCVCVCLCVRARGY